MFRKTYMGAEPYEGQETNDKFNKVVEEIKIIDEILMNMNLYEKLNVETNIYEFIRAEKIEIKKFLIDKYGLLNDDNVITWMDIKEQLKMEMKELESVEKKFKDNALLGRIKELEDKLKKYEEMNKITGFGYRRRFCSNCKKVGHTSSYCRNLIKKNNNGYSYSKLYNYKRRKIQNNSFTLDDFKNNFPETLGINKEKIQFCKLEKCRIKTQEGKKVVQKSMKIHQAIKERATQHINDLERRSIIRRSNSTWRNPIRFLEKPNGSLRLVVNFIKLNDLVEKDPQELNTIQDVLRETVNAKIFSVIDLKDAFYHIEIEENDKEKTAFEFNGKIYEWNCMVMGFKNSPQILQRTMNKVLDDLIGNGVGVYMDDLVVYAKTIEEHDEIMKNLLNKLKENNLKVNVDKIQFKRNEINLLGRK
ncbi:MAG: reverse transcriptase family protein, partial [Bacilli bacterium]